MKCKGLLDYRFKFRLRNMKNVFLCLAFLSFAFISSYQSFFSFDVPFPAILIFLFFMACYCLCCTNVKIKFTWIPLILLLRLIIFCINAVFVRVSMSTVLEQITITLCSVLIFLCGYNFLSQNKKELNAVLTAFSLVTSIQILVSVIYARFDKAGIVAGIGQSNYAACFLLLCIAYLLFVKTNRFEKIVIILDIVALLATQSFGAYLALFIVLVVFFIKNINWHSRKVRRSVFLILCVCAIGAVIFFNTSFGVGAWNKITEKIFYLLQGNWKNFGSSRGELFAFSWNNIKRNLLFGTIENYSPFVSEANPLSRWQGFRTHNILLESLLLYGIVGTVLNAVIALYICFYGKIRIKRDKTKYAFVPCFLAVIIHGMVEPSIFSLHFEIFIWLLIGAFLSGGRAVKTARRAASAVKNISTSAV